MQTDTSIITTTTKECSSYYPLSNSQTQSTWRDDVPSMMGDMKDDILTQVQNLFSVQTKEVIKEIKGELTGMVLEIVSTLFSPIIKHQSILLQHSMQSETRSRKRMGRNPIVDDIFEESEEKNT